METPKEKAMQLVEKFNSTGVAKELALICCDEILSAIDWHEFETPNKDLEYYQQVKSEIENKK